MACVIIIFTNRMDYQNIDAESSEGRLQKNVDPAMKRTFDSDSSRINQKDAYNNLESDISDDFIFKDFNGEREDQKRFHLNPQFKCVFIQRKFHQKSGNTPRKMIEVLIDYFPRFKARFPRTVSALMIKRLQELKEWHLSARENVYKLEHLINFFVEMEEEDPLNQLKRREIFSFILKKYAMASMNKPRSQIKSKSHYLRVMKLYSIRCRSKKLMERNQAR